MQRWRTLALFGRFLFTGLEYILETLVNDDLVLLPSAFAKARISLQASESGVGHGDAKTKFGCTRSRGHRP